MKRKIKSFIIRNLFRFFPTKIVISILFYIRHGYKLDWKNPKTFNEIINVKKIDESYLLYSKFTDKYLVKQYIDSVLGQGFCFPVIGVYRKMTYDIFNSLPNEFVMKSTHNSQCLSVVKDKKLLSKREISKIIKKQNKALKINGASQMHELQYKKVEPRIIVEKLMLDEKMQIPQDYKILCIKGVPQFIEVDLDRINDLHYVFMSPDWKLVPWHMSIFWRKTDNLPKKPSNLEKMLQIARTLSKDFTFVRVDLYDFNNHVYFGELTFLHDSGFSKFSDYNWDLYFGNKINGVIKP